MNEPCPICTKSAELVPDFDCITGDLRGKLCGRCARGLHNFDDDPNILHRAMTYLSGSNGEH